MLFTTYILLHSKITVYRANKISKAVLIHPSNVLDNKQWNLGPYVGTYILFDIHQVLT
jgi:hypothetical protein